MATKHQSPEAYFEDYIFLDFIEEELEDDDDYYEEEKERKAAVQTARRLLKKLVRVLVEESPKDETEFYKVSSKILTPGMDRIDFDVLDIEFFKDELMIIAEQFGYDDADPDLMHE